MAEIRISTDKVCELAEALRELAGLEDAPPGSNIDEGDDSAIASLEESEDDPRTEEISEMVRGLTEDERIDLVALVLVGREDFSIDEWDDAVASAAERIEEGGPDFAVEFIVGDMGAAEFLEAGLQLFGRDCADWDSETVSLTRQSPTDQTSNGDGNPGTGDIADAAQDQEPGVPHHLDEHVVQPKPPTRKS